VCQKRAVCLLPRWSRLEPLADKTGSTCPLHHGILPPRTRLVPCIGYLGHPFKKAAPWTFIARLFLVVRWDSAIERAGEWFSCTRENSQVWAADHQGRHTKALGEIYSRPLQTRRSQLDGPRPPAGCSHTRSRFRLPSGSHDAAHPGPEERSPGSLHPERKEPSSAVEAICCPIP
jgi:hypothetical protein